jgi:streptomycin 6-kinase
MLEIFRAHLRPLPGKRCRIVECTPFRFRCRQSTSRCVLQYTLRVVDPSSGRQWDQWVTGLIYAEPGAAERQWQKLKSGVAGEEIPEPWRSFEPVGAVAELDMVVEVFPYDRRLPQLSRVMNGAGRELEPLLLEGLGPGRWEAGTPSLEPTRYRTELGAVLRAGLPAREAKSGRSETARCYLKVYRDGRGQETFELLRSWAERSGERRGYSLVRPLAYWEELHTLVLEEAPGRSLRERLLEDRDPEGAVRTVARALAAFHLDGPGIRRCQPLADQLDDVTRASKLVQWACPEIGDKVRAVVAAVVAQLEEGPAAPCHGDLKAEHVFIDDGRVIFIDLDAVALGEPARDPAHFCSYVLGRVGTGSMSSEQAGRVATVFIEEYFQHVPASWRSQFRLHCAGALIEVACGIFRHQKSLWREQMQAAVERAQEALDGAFG